MISTPTCSLDYCAWRTLIRQPSLAPLVEAKEFFLGYVARNVEVCPGAHVGSKAPEILLPSACNPRVAEPEVKAGVSGTACARNNLHNAPRQPDQDPCADDAGFEPQVVMAPTAPDVVCVPLGGPS